jgi:heme-binding NEAT domain protein
MKLKAILLVVFVAGLAASLAFAAAPNSGKPGKPGSTTGSTTTTTSKKPKCQQVELKGNGTAGSVSFTVLKANKRGRSLVGTTVTLNIAAGAKVKAKACSAEGGALTLRDLHVKVKPAKK